MIFARGDTNYPVQFSRLLDPPATLYCKGWCDGFSSSTMLAVVGSRKMTPYGKRVISSLLSGLKDFNISIVSGFMYGVDAQAHEVALDLGMRTIAIMPCGIDVIHPPGQEDLYKRILSNGGTILSEYPDNTPPRIWTYPKRNRLVASLAEGVLVVEGARKSGSLITASIAHDLGVPVFGVPGPIFSDVSLGILDILADYAILVRDSSDILKGLHLETFVSDTFRGAESLCSAQYATSSSDSVAHRPSVEFKSRGVTPSKKVITCLSHNPLTLEEIASQTGLNVSILHSLIAELLLDGHISEIGGRFYAN